MGVRVKFFEERIANLCHHQMTWFWGTKNLFCLATHELGCLNSRGKKGTYITIRGRHVLLRISATSTPLFISELMVVSRRDSFRRTFLTFSKSLDLYCYPECLSAFLISVLWALFTHNILLTHVLWVLALGFMQVFSKKCEFTCTVMFCMLSVSLLKCECLESSKFKVSLPPSWDMLRV